MAAMACVLVAQAVLAGAAVASPDDATGITNAGDTCAPAGIRKKAR